MSNLSDTISIVLSVVDDTKGRIKKVSREIKELGTAGKTGGAGLDKTKKGAKGAAQEVDKLGKKSTKTKKKVEGLSKSVKGFFRFDWRRCSGACGFRYGSRRDRHAGCRGRQV